MNNHHESDVLIIRKAIPYVFSVNTPYNKDMIEDFRKIKGYFSKDKSWSFASDRLSELQII
jgi:hypothetical protein